MWKRKAQPCSSSFLSKIWEFPNFHILLSLQRSSDFPIGTGRQLKGSAQASGASAVSIQFVHKKTGFRVQSSVQNHQPLEASVQIYLPILEPLLKIFCYISFQFLDCWHFWNSQSFEMINLCLFSYCFSEKNKNEKIKIPKTNHNIKLPFP